MLRVLRGRPRLILDPATPILSALEVRLPTLKSMFPDLSIFCCYYLIVYSKNVIIGLALREIVSSVTRGRMFLWGDNVTTLKMDTLNNA